MFVVNLKHEECDVVVDRSTRWGNPFRMAEDTQAERERVIQLYRVWLWEQIQGGKVGLIDLAKLKDERLGCWCAPKKCHADVLLSAAWWAHSQLEP